jgi:Transglutaminase-like superfamily
LIAALARLRALPASERRCTCEAALLLLVVRITLALLPLPRALRLFGVAQGATGSGRIDPDQAALVGRAVARAARHVPFRAVCLQQAFAALLMLRRRGLAATVHFGLLREGHQLKAHAWSRCGEVAVTGVAVAQGFAPVATFAGQAFAE